MKTEKKTSRSLFATRLGVLAVTIGSSVGLGNIWRFPYEAGNHGGGAFIICYICFIILLGIPVICAEFVLGRQSRADFFGCFTRLHAPRAWNYMGFVGITASLLILSFYSVVAGWTLEYLWQSITGTLFETGVSHSESFTEFSEHSWRPLMWTLIFLLLNHSIVRGGVQKGIERVSNALMPLLFVILIALGINSLSLPGAAEGLSFMFSPDFSALTPGVVISAMGQAFFSLSIGLGCMLTYASYFSDKTPLLRNAGVTAGLDTIVALLAGIIIFPAVFTYGVHPAEGPRLVFEVLPDIFAVMGGGQIVSIAFFLMLAVASITSTISMSEISIAYFVDERGFSRRRACIVSSALAVIGGVMCTLSFSGVSDIHIGSYTLSFFNFFNNVTSNVMLPVGGLLICVFAGWLLDPKIMRRQLTNNGHLRYIPVGAVAFLLRYVCPVAIAVILLTPLLY